MFYIIALLISINAYHAINYYVTKAINSIFRHDLYNDLQLVDGYITLNLTDKSKYYLRAAYDKKDIYSALDKSNLIIRLAYLTLYNRLHKKTSNFKIYLAENILGNMFFSISFVKTIFKVNRYLEQIDLSSVTIEIENDCIEIITAKEVKTYLI